MLVDLQTITINAVAHALKIVEIVSRRVRRANADETVVLTTDQQTTNKGRKRHIVRFDWSKVVTDPLTSATDTDSTTINFSIDRPGYGFSQSDVENMTAAFKNWLTTAMVAELYSGQS